MSEPRFGNLEVRDGEIRVKRSSRSVPTGPGSRGGRWHEPEYRREYQRAWRDAHPEYRERERLRKARKPS